MTDISHNCQVEVVAEALQALVCGDAYLKENVAQHLSPLTLPEIMDANHLFDECDSKVRTGLWLELELTRTRLELFSFWLLHFTLHTLHFTLCFTCLGLKTQDLDLDTDLKNHSASH